MEKKKFVGWIVDRNSLLAKGITDQNLSCKQCIQSHGEMFFGLGVTDEDLGSKHLTNIIVCCRCKRVWNKEKMKWLKA